MSEYEYVSELVNKTGASYNEAKYAYEATGGDMLAAVIMLEKAKGIRTEKQENENAKAAGAGMSGNGTRGGTFGDNASGNSFSGGIAGGKSSDAINKGVKSAQESLNRVCGKTVKVAGRREYFSMPLPAFAIIFAAAWHMSLPAFVISLLCGVKYTFSGENAKDVVIGFDMGKRHSNGGFSEPRYYPNGWQGQSMQQDMQQNSQQSQPSVQDPGVQIPRPVQQPQPMQYAGGNPLESEDKGFFN